MKLGRKDLIFIAIVVAFFTFLFWGTGKELGPFVPEDATHREFYQALAQKEKRKDLEKGCPECHQWEFLPKNHPPKEQCMFCHLPPES